MIWWKIFFSLNPKVDIMNNYGDSHSSIKSVKVNLHKCSCFSIIKNSSWLQGNCAQNNCQNKVRILKPLFEYVKKSSYILKNLSAKHLFFLNQQTVKCQINMWWRNVTGLARNDTSRSRYKVYPSCKSLSCKCTICYYNILAICWYWHHIFICSTSRLVQRVRNYHRQSHANLREIPLSII